MYLLKRSINLIAMVVSPTLCIAVIREVNTMLGLGWDFSVASTDEKILLALSVGVNPVVSTPMCTASGIRPGENKRLFNWVITGAFPANRSTRSANISFSVIYSNDKVASWCSSNGEACTLWCLGVCCGNVGTVATLCVNCAFGGNGGACSIVVCLFLALGFGSGGGNDVDGDCVFGGIGGGCNCCGIGGGCNRCGIGGGCNRCAIGGGCTFCNRGFGIGGGGSGFSLVNELRNSDWCLGGGTGRACTVTGAPM